MAKAGFWLRGSRGKLAGASMSKGAGGSTVIREIVTPRNPKTIAQSMQRMKARPAHKFYAAFAEMLNNAFEGVNYGNDSRLKFLSLAMKQEGPYIQKGVEKFIPAAYPFSRGSLPTVAIEPFGGGATVITLSATSTEATITPAILAAALGVSTDYQISLAVVNNEFGIFKPSYIGFDNRLKIADLPANCLGKDANHHITIDIVNVGLEADAVVAMAVVLSTQDASGSWLRSDQDMVISNELHSQLYSSEALDAALASYGEGASNTINSSWYYNLGLNQAFAGRIAIMDISVGQQGEMGVGDCFVGVRQGGGRVRYTVFVDSMETPTGLYCLNGNNAQLVDLTFDLPSATMIQTLRNAGYDVELWSPEYAIQAGYGNTNNDNNNSLTINTAAGNSVTLVGVKNIEGTYGSGAESEHGNVVVAYDAENNNYLIKNGNTEVWAYGTYLINADKYMNDQPMPAWGGNITSPNPTDATTVVTEEPNDSLAEWLISQGVSYKVFISLP